MAYLLRKIINDGIATDRLGVFLQTIVLAIISHPV